MLSSVICRLSGENVFLVTRQLHLVAQLCSKSTRSPRFHTFSVLAMEGKARGGRGPGGDRRMTREAVVLGERERYVSMPIKEKRLQYKCGSKYITLDTVPTWSKLLKSEKYQRLKKDYRTSKYRANNALNDKITIWKGDITKLEIDGIANAANGSLLGGGGVDGAIHAAAGNGLRQECALLSGCDTGEAKITGGYKLPAKYVIHTVGPMGEKETKLRDCYQNCLRLLKENKLRSLAFPCISTGIYGYPNLPAAEVALETTRQWLDTDKNSELVDRIVFCLFMPTDVSIYEDLMYHFFPPGADGEDSDSEAQGNDAENTEPKGEPAKEASESDKEPMDEATTKVEEVKEPMDEATTKVEEVKEPMDEATTKVEEVKSEEATLKKEEDEEAKEEPESKGEQKADAEGASVDNEACAAKPETDTSTEADKER